MKMLKKGATGTDVKTLQTALNRAGCNLTVDGIFGSKTQTAVKNFQKSHGLTVDGIVGDNTWKALTPYTVTDEAFRKAFNSVLADIEKLPSYKKFSEMIPND